MKCICNKKEAVGFAYTFGYPLCSLCAKMMNMRLNRDNMENRELVYKYPFLFPYEVVHERMMDTDYLESDEIYDYSYTMLDGMPDGWRAAFGLQFLEELKELLIKGNCLHEYRVVQVKEKFGELRWYDNGVPDTIYDEYMALLAKYEDLSTHICVECGKTAVGMTQGWIMPVCKDHTKGRNITYYNS
jgi:hypothetical protein